MGLSLNELMDSLSEYQRSLNAVDFAQDTVNEIKVKIQRLMLSIASFAPDPSSLEKNDTAANFEKIKRNLEALNVSISHGFYALGSGNRDAALKTYLT